MGVLLHRTSGRDGMSLPGLFRPARTGLSWALRPPRKEDLSMDRYSHMPAAELLDEPFVSEHPHQVGARSCPCPMGVWQVRGDRTGDPRPPFQVRARVDGDPQPDLGVHQMWSPTTAL